MFHVFTQLADGLTNFIGFNLQTKEGNAFHFFIEDIMKIFFLLALMVYLAGWLRAGVSPEKIKNWLQGKSRFLGYILAVILGSITPFCSCSSVPLFIGFLAAGIPLGTAIAFLITSPLINEIAVILFGEAFGLAFTVSYILVGLSLGVLGGYLTDQMASQSWVENYVWQINVKKNDLDSHRKPMTWQERHNFAIEEVKDIIQRVWIFVLVGVGLGALIHGYIPQEWFLKYAGSNNPFSVTIASLIGIPLYSNITGVIPIAKVLIGKGLPLGTTLALIISSVAISLPEILILRKVLKPKALVLLTFYLFVAINLIGYFFNYLFSKGVSL